MKKFIDSLRNRLSRLQPRERQLLLAGIVMLFVYRYLCGFVTDNGET